MIWVIITNLGDSAVMVPSIIIIFLWLLAACAPRLAFGWLGLCAAAIGTVTLTKVAFIGWGIGIEALDFTGISGHSTLAVSVCTSVAFLLTLGRSDKIQRLAVGAGLALGLLVACSRIPVHAHSASEALAGVTLGIAVAFTFISMARRVTPLRASRVYLLALALLIPLAGLYGERAPTPGLITKVALQLSGHSCPFTRAHYDRPACVASVEL